MPNCCASASRVASLQSHSGADGLRVSRVSVNGIRITVLCFVHRPDRSTSPLAAASTRMRSNGAAGGEAGPSGPSHGVHANTGKDCAWALHTMRQSDDAEVVGLLTTVTETCDRVAMHGVRRSLLEAQAEEAGIPLWIVPIPSPCSNEQYEAAMGAAMRRARR